MVTAGMAGTALSGCVTGIWLLELTGFGFSLEQPTAREQAISTAAKTSALMWPQVVVATFLASLPQATESRVPAMLRIALMRVMVGHLLPTSGAMRSARGGPVVGTLIWRGLERCSLGGNVERGTRVWARGHAKSKSPPPRLRSGQALSQKARQGRGTRREASSINDSKRRSKATDTNT